MLLPRAGTNLLLCPSIRLVGRTGLLLFDPAVKNFEPLWFTFLLAYVCTKAVVLTSVTGSAETARARTGSGNPQHINLPLPSQRVSWLPNTAGIHTAQAYAIPTPT